MSSVWACGRTPLRLYAWHDRRLQKKLNDPKSLKTLMVRIRLDGSWNKKKTNDRWSSIHIIHIASLRRMGLKGLHQRSNRRPKRRSKDAQQAIPSTQAYAGHCHTHTQICTQICIHACMPQWYIIWVCHRCWNNTPRYTSAVYACVQTWVYLRQNREVGFERYSEWIRATKES